MIDMIAAVFIICFVIGVISSALFVASFFLYRESRRGLPSAEAVTPATAVAAAGKVCSQREESGVHRADCSAATVKRRGDQSGKRSCSSDNNSSDGASCSYTCEVCGSCGATEGHGTTEELRQGQGDNRLIATSCPCGEFFISDADVSFRCQSVSGTHGAFFFYRGRHPGEVLKPISPSNQYLSIAALPSVPYHLWLCSAQHPTRSRRCSHCRQVLCFELRAGEILFHQRVAAKRRMRGVWLLICEESPAGGNRVLYRGEAWRLSSLQYAGKLSVYFGPPEATDRLPDAGGSESAPPIAALLDQDKHSAQGDLKSTAASFHHLALRCRDDVEKVGSDGSNGDSCNLDNDEDTRTSSTKSLRSLQSPLSMGSMRKAVKWPITQIENLMESSSSDEPQTDAAIPLSDLRPTSAAAAAAPAAETAEAAAAEEHPTAHFKAGFGICEEGDRFSTQQEGAD